MDTSGPGNLYGILKLQDIMFHMLKLIEFASYIVIMRFVVLQKSDMDCGKFYKNR